MAEYWAVVAVCEGDAWDVLDPMMFLKESHYHGSGSSDPYQRHQTRKEAAVRVGEKEWSQDHCWHPCRTLVVVVVVVVQALQADA
jgi:hypothetical protein